MSQISVRGTAPGEGGNIFLEINETNASVRRANEIIELGPSMAKSRQMKPSQLAVQASAVSMTRSGVRLSWELRNRSTVTPNEGDPVRGNRYDLRHSKAGCLQH